MPIVFKQIIVTQAFCDVCGKGPLSIYKSVHEVDANNAVRDLTPDELLTHRVDGGTDPRAKFVSCITHDMNGPAIDSRPSQQREAAVRPVAHRRRDMATPGPNRGGPSEFGR